MGDRANFGFREAASAPIVNLYAHWGGSGMMATLANALEVARPRWDDSGYATRIAISQIVGEDWNNETGYGIYVNTLGDNEHSVPVVTWDAKTVTLYPDNFWKYEDAGEPKFVMGFDAFIAKFSKTPSLV